MTEKINKQIDINNINIYYKDSQKELPPIVFIHGNSQSSNVFNFQLEDNLLNEHFRLIAIDLPGHGLSDKALNPESTYSFSGYGKLIGDFCDKLNLKDILFVGSSLGGNFLFESINDLNAQGLLVFGAAPFTTLEDLPAATIPEPEKFSYLFNEIYNDDDIEFVLTYQFSDDFDSSKTPPFLREDLLKTDGLSRVFLGQNLSQNAIKDAKFVVKDLKIPIAVVHGLGERLIDLEYLKKIEAPTLWQGKIIEIANAGHSIQIEKPAEFNKVLFDFAESIF